MHFTVCELCLLVDKNHIGVLEVGAPSLGSQEAWFWVRTERKWCHPGMVCPQDWGWGFPQEWKPREDHSWMKQMSLGHEAGYQCLSLWSTGMMLGGEASGQMAQGRPPQHQAEPERRRWRRHPQETQNPASLPFPKCPKGLRSLYQPQKGQGSPKNDRYWISRPIF